MLITIHNLPKDLRLLVFFKSYEVHMDKRRWVKCIVLGFIEVDREAFTCINR